jgi:hypothetical protein
VEKRPIIHGKETHTAVAGQVDVAADMEKRHIVNEKVTKVDGNETYPPEVGLVDAGKPKERGRKFSKDLCIVTLSSPLWQKFSNASSILVYVREYTRVLAFENFS